MISRPASMPESLDVFATCPQSGQTASAAYCTQVKAAARWAEQAGCKGILVYSDNSLVDSWLVSQLIVESTAELCPLIAVQPVYMHPYSIAKMITSLAYLHDRRGKSLRPGDGAGDQSIFPDGTRRALARPD